MKSFRLVNLMWRVVVVALLSLGYQLVYANQWGAGAPITVVSTGNAGQYASMTTVNGNPAIAYFLGAPDNDLMYVRATDATGTAWGTPVAVQTTGTVGRFTQLLVVNGNPAIAYRNSSGSGLSYIRATDANGTTWGTPVAIGGAFVASVSMAIVDGRPAIAYHDNFTSLNYVRANDADGTTWGTPVVLDSSTPNGTGLNASLAVINGNPAISYQNVEGTGSQKYIRATDTTGTTWGTAVVVDSAGAISTGGEGDLAEVNGRPTMTYQRDNNLYYVRANDATGAAWGTPQNLAPTARFTSLTIVAGHPAISYFKYDTGDLRYIRASNPDGTAWNPIVEVDNAVTSVGRYSQLEIIAGHPAIAYQDETILDLKYARSPNPTAVTLSQQDTAAVGQPLYWLGWVLLLVGGSWWVWRGRALR
ncbi:MAG: hypothetical protein OT477_23990 [Chloroflexi bacterium]|nr:hypothetical protein [Chloroflexota bacterium]